MIECSTGDVVLLPFPFTDFSTFKQRPALVISSPKWNARRPDIIIAAISSRMHGSEFEYILNEKEERTGGLRVPSAVRLGNIYTIDKCLVREVLGSLDKKNVQSIQAKIHQVISVA